jgi:ornithine carbamoyltransferase
LIDLTDLSGADIRRIWALADADAELRHGSVAWSFEGDGVRTRTTFIQAFRALGLDYIELPNLLKSDERPQDLAGYLDPNYDLYVIRERDHGRLSRFAAESRRPVINAMSASGHPCEVLSDAWWLDRVHGPIESRRILLFGPATNVLRSWAELAEQLSLPICQVAPAGHACNGATLRVAASPDGIGAFDLIVTDGWPAGFRDPAFTLSEDLANLFHDQTVVLPTPPFSPGREIDAGLVEGPRFAGYEQKTALTRVQRAILQFFMGAG